MYTHIHTKQKAFECVLNKCTNRECEMYLRDKQFCANIYYIKNDIITISSRSFMRNQLQPFLSCFCFRMMQTGKF